MCVLSLVINADNKALQNSIIHNKTYRGQSNGNIMLNNSILGLLFFIFLIVLICEVASTHRFAPKRRIRQAHLQRDNSSATNTLAF